MAAVATDLEHGEGLRIVYATTLYAGQPMPDTWQAVGDLALALVRAMDDRKPFRQQALVTLAAEARQAA